MKHVGTRQGDKRQRGRFVRLCPGEGGMTHQDIVRERTRKGRLRWAGENEGVYPGQRNSTKEPGSCNLYTACGRDRKKGRDLVDLGTTFSKCHHVPAMLPSVFHLSSHVILTQNPGGTGMGQCTCFADWPMVKEERM